MRFLSIVALFGLASATYISPNLNLGSRSPPPLSTLPCPQGSSSSAGPCQACPSGYSSPGGSSPCNPCPANTYSNAGGLCTDCPAGTTSGTGAGYCQTLTCSAGRYPNVHTCSACPAGTYSNAGDSTCTNCSAGLVSSSGSNRCTGCSPGWAPNSSAQSCVKCPANTYATRGGCLDCMLGSTSPPGSTSCSVPPQPSGLTQPPTRRAEEKCLSRRGHKWCPVFSGQGKECVNVLTSLEMCGGCVDPFGKDTEPTGRDCSSIPHVDQVKCERGHCNILKCRPGYMVGPGECVPASGHGTKVKRAAILHARRESF